MKWFLKLTQQARNKMQIKTIKNRLIPNKHNQREKDKHKLDCGFHEVDKLSLELKSMG